MDSFAGFHKESTDPFGAFGMNTGIQDAYNLGWKLALVLQNKASASLLDTYEEKRLPVAREVLAESDRQFTMAADPSHIKPFLVAQQRRGRDDHPHYRNSSLSYHHSRKQRSRMQAGDSIDMETLYMLISSQEVTNTF